MYSHYDNSLRINVNAAERMRIESDGNIPMGATSAAISGIDSRLALVCDTTNQYLLGLNSTDSGATNHNYVVFHRDGTAVGSIKATDTTTQFNTTSDYRLKENINYNFDATSRLKQLKPARFNFIANADKTVDGFLAHEVSSIVPEAISGEKDATRTYTDNDDNEQTVIEPQGIDQSKLVPLLVKTIQELEARITTLETE
jgi:hypothetical protein